MDPRETRTIVRLPQTDSDLIDQALTEFIRYHGELAANMVSLAATGGNGLITESGARLLANTHYELAERAEILGERLQSAALALVSE